MAELAPGADAPAIPVDNAPGAQPVIAPDAPVVGTGEPDKGIDPVKPKTYSEEEHRKGISERLSKERKRLERTVRAELERDFYKQQLEGAQRPRTEAQPKGPPQRADFENDAEGFVRAVARYEAQQLREQERQEHGKEGEAERAQRQAMDRMRVVTEKLFEPGIAKYRDFQEVVLDDDVPITQVMIAAAVRMKAGVDVLYHLGKNPSEAARISQLPDIEQAWELKAIEARLAAPPTVSKAPTPIVPGNPAAPSKSPYDGTSTADHVKAWLKRPK